MNAIASPDLSCILLPAELERDVPVAEESGRDDRSGGILRQPQAGVEIERHVRPVVVAEPDRAHLTNLHPGDHDRGPGLQTPELVEIGGEQEATRSLTGEAPDGERQVGEGGESDEDEDTHQQVTTRRSAHAFTPPTAP